MITNLSIPCVWGGQLAGILLKNSAATTISGTTKKIIGVHGWLDNLSSLLPLAQKLVDRHPNYEICLYDRAGHGFSNHLPKGSDYSYACNLRDLRTITQALGWTADKCSLIGHSYGAQLAMAYAAIYPEEVSCLVALDSLLGGESSTKAFWKNVANRLDRNLQYHTKSPRIHKGDLTYEKALELVRSSRAGLDDPSAKLLAERSVRRDANNRLHFTHDGALKNFPIMPFTQGMADDAIRAIQASILFIGAVSPQWPVSKSSLQALKEANPHFEVAHVDGSHHFHMTQVDLVLERIEQYFQKYLK